MVLSSLMLVEFCGVLGLVDVPLDHAGGDPGVGQVVQVVVGDRRCRGRTAG